MYLEVCSLKDEKLCSISFEHTDATVADVKRQVSMQTKIPTSQLALRAEKNGKDLPDDIPLPVVGQCLSKLYMKNLGRQVDWQLTFLLEYTGPLLIYAFIFFMPGYIYDENQLQTKLEQKPKYLPFILWSAHYLKRTWETLFVHRFSHNTMPIANSFRNCLYYWGFAWAIAYHINHPNYVAPHPLQCRLGTITFIICEVGNLSVHMLLRDLRPAGSKKRNIPLPNRNPLTSLFNYVSCPNYTYEFGAWLGFSSVVNCLYANIFMFLGFYQMTVWALQKHKRYHEEFADYPKGRKAIIPMLI